MLQCFGWNAIEIDYSHSTTRIRLIVYFLVLSRKLCSIIRRWREMTVWEIISLRRNPKRGKCNATEKAEEFNNPDAIFTRPRIFLLIILYKGELHLTWCWMKGVEGGTRASVILFIYRISQDVAGESESPRALLKGFDLLEGKKKPCLVCVQRFSIQWENL